MTIIAERGLFVRLLVQSGKFASADAEVLADALDASTREPATKADLNEVRAELKADIAELRGEVKMQVARLDGKIDLLVVSIAKLEAKIDTGVDRLMVRLGAWMLAVVSALFAALRYL